MQSMFILIYFYHKNKFAHFLVLMCLRKFDKNILAIAKIVCQPWSILAKTVFVEIFLIEKNDEVQDLFE